MTLHLITNNEPRDVNSLERSCEPEPLSFRDVVLGALEAIRDWLIDPRTLSGMVIGMTALMMGFWLAVGHS